MTNQELKDELLFLLLVIVGTVAIVTVVGYVIYLRGGA